MEGEKEKVAPNDVVLVCAHNVHWRAIVLKYEKRTLTSPGKRYELCHDGHFNYGVMDFLLFPLRFCCRVRVCLLDLRIDVSVKTDDVILLPRRSEIGGGATLKFLTRESAFEVWKIHTGDWNWTGDLAAQVAVDRKWNYFEQLTMEGKKVSILHLRVETAPPHSALDLGGVKDEINLDTIEHAIKEVEGPAADSSGLSQVLYCSPYRVWQFYSFPT